MLGQNAWVAVRANNDYPAFQPHLADILRLRQEQAEYLGYQEHIYDALLFHNLNALPRLPMCKVCLPALNRVD